MSTVVVTRAMKELLCSANSAVQLIDEEGRPVGSFTPSPDATDPDWPITKDELASRSRKDYSLEQCRTLDEILISAGYQ